MARKAWGIRFGFFSWRLSPGASFDLARVSVGVAKSRGAYKNPRPVVVGSRVLKFLG